MDKFLRFDPWFSFREPTLEVHSYLVNDEDKIIGLRFCSELIEFSNTKTYVDIPISSLIACGDTFSNKEIKNLIEIMCDNEHMDMVVIFGNAKTPIFYRKAPEDEVLLSDDFLPVWGADENTTSIYMPNCVIRYENGNFAKEGYKLLAAFNELLDMDGEDFINKLGITGIEYLQFINSPNLVVRLKSSKMADLMEDESPLNIFRRDGMKLEIDVQKYDLVLVLYENYTPFGIEIMPIECNETGWYKKPFNQDKLVDVYLDKCEFHELSIAKKSSLPKDLTVSPDAKTFCDGFNSDNSGIFYHFTKVNYNDAKVNPQDYFCDVVHRKFIPRETLQVGFEEMLDFFEESSDMDVLRVIREGDEIYKKSNISYKNGHTVAVLNVSVTVNIRFFGEGNVNEVLDIVSTNFKKRFRRDDIIPEVTYDDLDKSFWFSLEFPV